MRSFAPRKVRERNRRGGTREAANQSTNDVAKSGAASGDEPAGSATHCDHAQADATQGNDADALNRNQAETAYRNDGLYLGGSLSLPQLRVCSGTRQVVDDPISARTARCGIGSAHLSRGDQERDRRRLERANPGQKYIPHADPNHPLIPQIPQNNAR